MTEQQKTRSRIASSLSHVSALTMGIALPEIVRHGHFDGTILLSIMLMAASLAIRHPHIINGKGEDGI